MALGDGTPDNHKIFFDAETPVDQRRWRDLVNAMYTGSQLTVRYTKRSGKPVPLPGVSSVLMSHHHMPEEPIPEEGPMETYMGYVYGVRFYTWPVGLGFIIGGRSGKWYAKRQKARCRSSFGNWTTMEEYRIKNEPSPHNFHACGINSYSIAESLIGEPQYDSCRQHLRETLEPENARGIYGLHFEAKRGAYSTLKVAAVCRSWGKVVMCDKGYRSSHSEVVSLSVSPMATAAQVGEMDWLLTGNHKRAGFKGVPVLEETVEQFQDRVNAQYMAADVIKIPEQEGAC